MSEVENLSNHTRKNDDKDKQKLRHQNSNPQSKKSGPARNTTPPRSRNRRPDKQLYVPRPRRNDERGVINAATTTVAALPDDEQVPTSESKNKNKKVNRSSTSDRRYHETATGADGEPVTDPPVAEAPPPSTVIENWDAPDENEIRNEPRLIAIISEPSPQNDVDPPIEHPTMTAFINAVYNCQAAFAVKQPQSSDEDERTKIGGFTPRTASVSSTSEPDANYGCYENGVGQEMSDEIFVDVRGDRDATTKEADGDPTLNGEHQISGQMSESASEVEEEAEVGTGKSRSAGCAGGISDAAAAPATSVVVSQFRSENKDATTSFGGDVAKAAVGRGDQGDAEDSGDDDDDTWDAIYDENGDCLDPELELQISNCFGPVSIQVPHIDYLEFKTKKLDLSDEEYGHVIEIFDFPSEFKTQDLLAAFLKFQEKGFDIKWVDDTHALGVFASQIAASDALSICHPFIKTRPLSQATPESKKKARRHSEFLKPYKQRPQTSAALARRMVSSALGLSLPVSRETREVERKKLVEAKERKKLAAKQKEAAWEGQIGSAE